MKVGDIIQLTGYDIMASAICDYGHVLVLNNNSSHYLVVEVESSGEGIRNGVHTVQHSETGRLVASFEYGSLFIPAYKSALGAMITDALSHTSESE